MNKIALLHAIITTLEAQVAAYTKAAQSAFDAATDPDSKAENKYDTRTLEASYVARGQATRLAETEQALSSFRALSARETRSGNNVTLGSYVVVQASNGAKSHYFIGPAAGGTEIIIDDIEVVVITSSSPLGQQLMGQQQGASIALRLGPTAQQIQLIEVQ
jgi:transcription elongation GreA/GreB family factor